MGEILVDGDKVFGSGVNLASRIESLGKAGSILFSKKIQEEIKNLSSSNDFYLHSDDDGELALNTSLIQAIEFNDEDGNKRGAGLVSSD